MAGFPRRYWQVSHRSYSVVRTAPRSEKRRADDTTGGLKVTTRPTRPILLEKSRSSKISSFRKPPRASNTSVRTKIA